MYIVHYAELEPDPALLAINNFQRDMQNENQLIRALGLRVMSSIRLRVIVQVCVTTEATVALICRPNSFGRW